MTGNKLGKKGAFSTPKKHMEDAMGNQSLYTNKKNLYTHLVGGNMTTLTGCPTETSRGNYSSNYAFLSNCSALIDDKCTPVKPEEAQMTAMEKCNTEMTKIKKASEGKDGWTIARLITIKYFFSLECRKFSDDGATQCICWITLQGN